MSGITLRRCIPGVAGVPHAILVAGALLFTLVSPAPVAARQNSSTPCRPSGPLVRLPGLAEASGLAVSRQVPGRLWTHNDSGEPVLYTLDGRGAITGQVRVTGAAVTDWEAVAVGPCGNGSCIYIGDIGDNEAERDHVTVYRVPEPGAGVSTAAVAEVLRATYPAGPQDAEALLIDANGRLHIVTKGETGPVGIYRFPATPQAGATMKLERVGTTSPKRDAALRITDGAISPDGQWAALRTRSSLRFYRTSDLLAGRWTSAATVDLTPLKEPQGEGLALGAGDAVFLSGEGGGKNQPGTFIRFTCAPSG